LNLALVEKDQLPRRGTGIHIVPKGIEETRQVVRGDSRFRKLLQIVLIEFLQILHRGLGMVLNCLAVLHGFASFPID
jgi:hypothetical protein